MKKTNIFLFCLAVALTGCSDTTTSSDSERSEITTETETSQELITDGISDTDDTSDITTTSEPEMDVYSLYKEFFSRTYGTDDLVYLADVTHDGIDDMIVITTNDQYMYDGYVYTVKNNSIVKTYQKSGATDHAGGFFNWYLIKSKQGWNLAEEYFDMWQGHGETGFREYYVNDTGEQEIILHLKTPESTADLDSDGRILDQAFDCYVQDLNRVRKDAYVLFSSYTESSVEANTLNASPSLIFGIVDTAKETAPVTTELPVSSVLKLENKTGYTIQGCNLRSTPSKDSNDNIIAELPTGTPFTADELVDDYWYHIQCSYGSGYISYKMAGFGTENDIKESVAQMEQIAEQLYAANGQTVVSRYTYSGWDFDYSDCFVEDEWAHYTAISGMHSLKDVLEYLHKTFSAKYDEYNRVETSGDPREEGIGAIALCIYDEDIFREVDGKVYAFTGECPYSLGTVQAQYIKTEGNEVWFKMTATQWASGSFTADFSMIKENGTWKIGAAIYPRY